MAVNADLSPFLKTRFLKESIVAIPDLAIIQEIAKFNQAAKLGEKVQVPVVLRRSGGHTVGASGAGITLNPSKGFESGRAEVVAFQHMIEERVTLSDVARAASDDQAYQILEQNVLLPSIMSFRTRVEQHLLNGGVLGKVASVAGNVLTIDAAFWADAIWAGCENTTNVDVFSAMTGGTTRGTSATVTAIDFDAKSVTVPGLTGAAAGDFIFLEGTRGVITPSLRDQMANTAGTMLNINAANYPLWRATQHVIPNSGSLNFAEAMKAAAKGVGRGSLSEDCILLANQVTIQNLANDMAALRSFDSSYGAKKGENGFEAPKYKAAAGFMVETMAHPLMFPGEAYIIPKNGLGRYGSVDIMVGQPAVASSEEDLYYTIPGTNYLGYKLFTEQAVALLTPAKAIRITNANGTAL